MASPTISKTGMAPVTCIAPGGGVTVDVPVLIGSLFGIPGTTVAAGASFELQCHFQASLPKSGVAMSAGDRLFWSVGLGQFTLTPTDSDVGAICITAAGAGATEVEVEVGCPCKATTSGIVVPAVAATGAKLVLAEPTAGGTSTFTIEAPALAASRTIALPDRNLDFTGAAIGDAAAATAPAAGTGSGADGTTFAGAECDALVADVADIRTQLNTALAALRTAGIIAP